jgi:hypothetical protein
MGAAKHVIGFFFIQVQEFFFIMSMATQKENLVPCS